MLVPLDSMKESLDFFEGEVSVYPIWLSPFRLPNNPGMLNARNGRENM